MSKGVLGGWFFECGHMNDGIKIAMAGRISGADFHHCWVTDSVLLLIRIGLLQLGLLDYYNWTIELLELDYEYYTVYILYIHIKWNFVHNGIP